MASKMKYTKGERLNIRFNRKIKRVHQVFGIVHVYLAAFLRGSRIKEKMSLVNGKAIRIGF